MIRLSTAGEEWTYECTTIITETTLNTATATMEGELGPITREDEALRDPAARGDQHREDAER